MTYTYAELFAGAGGLSMGLDMAGFVPAAHAEIEPHARAVLRHHWPDTRLDGDVSQLNGADYAGITLLSGGSPCQDLSVAGKRGGMTEGSGTRSSLYFQQVRIWQESNAPYFLWENVLGALSSNTGRDFAAVLSALVGATLAVPDDGWRSAGVASGPTGVAAWRVLDAQYFGVPQRRRRVFVLGARAGGVDPAEVLSVSESVSGYSETCGTSPKNIASDTGAGVEGASGCLTPWDNQSKRVFLSDGIFPSLQAAENSGQQQPAVLAFTNRPDIMLGESVDSLTSEGFVNPHSVLTYEWHNQDSRIREVEVAASLNLNAEGREGHLILPLTQTLFTKQGFGEYAETPNADLAVSVGVPRRLMPVECERLMGWPDQHTAHGVDERGRAYALSDTSRYKLCGNGVASPVAAGIGFRLKQALDSFTA